MRSRRVLPKKQDCFGSRPYQAPAFPCRSRRGRWWRFAKARDILVLADNSLLGHDIVKPLEEGCDMVFTYAPTEADRAVGWSHFPNTRGLPKTGFPICKEPMTRCRGRSRLRRCNRLWKHFRSAWPSGGSSSTARRLPERGWKCCRVVLPGGGCPDLSVIFCGLSEQVDAVLARLSRFRPELVRGSQGTLALCA